MLVRVPEYYHQFHCLAGACPHSCCEKWEVVLDEEHIDLYKGVSGTLGDKLRAAMTEDADGDTCFALNGSRCPFLDEENLCEIHRQLGEDATSITCQEHPRFTEDFGPFREITLSASCPAANALLLGSAEPLRFTEWEDENAAEAGDEWLDTLLPMREELMAVLTDRSRPLKERLGDFLRLGAEQQAWLDQEESDAVSHALPTLPENACAFLEGLEVLEPDWHEVLRQAETASGDVCDDALERVAVYFAFRYLLKAVNDGDLLGRARFVVFSVLTIERLAAVCGLSEALRRFSCEIEHSDENLDAVLASLTNGQLCMLPTENDL